MKKNNSAFTLLELLTVMAIMVVMMSIAGASYYGMRQGAAMRGSASNVITTLSLARQYAVNHRARTYVNLWYDKTNSFYQVFVEAGRNQNPVNNSTVFWWENLLDIELVGADVLNPETGKRGTVGLVEDKTNGGIIYKTIQAIQDNYITDNIRNMIRDNASATKDYFARHPGELMKWQNEDRMAWELNDAKSISENIKYANNNYQVVFKPDGTAKQAVTINLLEVRGSATKTVNVTLFGKIY